MDIQGIECVSKVLVLISSSLALMGILFKGANEFFLNTIRMEYNTIPGQKSVFSMVVTMVVGLIFVADILFVIADVMFLTIYIMMIITSKFNTVSGDADSVFNSIFLIVFLLVYACAHIININNFARVWKCYSDEFEGKRECHIKQGSSFIVSLVLHIIIIAISTFVILTGVLYDYWKIAYDELGILIGIDISSIVGFSISYSLRPVVKAINEKKKYILTIGKKKINCRLYLDIGEYYLLFLMGKETYIRKTEVKEIICDNVKSTIKKNKKKVNDKNYKVEEQKMKLRNKN